MRNRWLIAGAALLTHLCLGSVYAWSVFVGDIRKLTQWSEPRVTWAFSFAICALGLTAAFLSPLMQRWGPRKSVGVSAALFGTGLLGCGLSLQHQSVVGLYISYGLVGGIGLGMGYVPPVTTLLKWFADRKGLATGLAVSGFGLGAMIASFYGQWLLTKMGVAQVFLVMGATYLPLLFLASRFLCLPPQAAAAASKAADGAPELPATRRFALLWSIFFLNIATGILLIALAKPMLAGSFGFASGVAVAIVAVMNLCNGLGRFLWSAASDRLGRFTTWTIMLLLQTALFVLLAVHPTPWLFAGSICLIASCYGGGFALCPAMVADLFGARRAPRLYGMALTAWSAAAVASPPLAAWLRQQTGSNHTILVLCTGASLAGTLVLAVLWRLSKAKAETTANSRPLPVASAS